MPVLLDRWRRERCRHRGGAGLDAASLARGLAAVAVAALLALPSAVPAFSLLGNPLDLRGAMRWSAEDYLGTGLHDGIQVAVAAGIAEALGVAPADIPVFQETIRDAFAAWENQALQFQVSFDGPVVEGTAIGQGFEIDLFAAPAAHPIFNYGSFFAATSYTTEFVEERLLTNGQRASGSIVTGADIFVNIDNVLAFRDILQLDIQEQRAALQRLLMHEIGHALGLNHPNEVLNLDTDTDPLNAMPIDPCDWEAGIRVSVDFDEGAVMVNELFDFGSLFFTALRNDELGGRDLLYPVPPPGVTCAPLPLAPPPLPPPVSDEEGTVIIYSSGDGRENSLYAPYGVAVGPSGKVYVSAAGSDNVFEIAPDGTATEIFDASGDGMGRVLKGANALAVGPDERVYVTGLGSNNAFQIDPDGTVTEILDASGDGLGHTVDQPSSLAVDLFGNVWVGAAVTRNVFRIASSGSIDEVLGSSDGQPSAIVADGLGNVYVATRITNSVYKIAPDGAVTTALGSSGAGGVPLIQPTAMAVDTAHNVYVAGAFGRTFRITSDGQASFLFDESAAGSGLSLESPLRLATDGLGNLFAASVLSMNIVRRSPFGELEEVFIGQPIQVGGYGFITNIAGDAAGNLYMTRIHANVAVRLVPAPSGPLAQGAALVLVLLLGRRRRGAAPSGSLTVVVVMLSASVSTRTTSCT